MAVFGRRTDESNDHEDALENDDRNAHLGLVADVGSDPQKPDGGKIAPCGEKTGFQSSVAHTLYMISTKPKEAAVMFTVRIDGTKKASA